MKKMLLFIVLVFSLFGFKANATYQYVNINTLPGYTYHNDGAYINITIPGNYTNYTPFFLYDGVYYQFTNYNTTEIICIGGANDLPLNDGFTYNSGNTLLKYYFMGDFEENLFLKNKIYIYIENSTINGTCGTNAISYLSGATSYNGTFCTTGTPSPISPNFPLPGQTVNWTCQGSNGGKTESCSATKMPLTISSSKLKQFVKLPEAPELPQQEIGVGAKVGKFQSGSGIILSAYYDNNTNMSVNFEFEVYRLGEQNPVHLFESEDISTGTGRIEVPFSMLGVGEYFWKARVKRSDGAVSNWVDYNTNYAWEYDFSYFSGFEPYPYGYKFKNSVPAKGLLTGGISNFHFTYPFHYREKVDGTRWELFNKIYPEWKFGSEEEMFAKFEESGFDKDEPYSKGNCFGMAFTAGMQYKSPSYMSFNFNNFSNQVGTGYIWNKIDSIGTNIIGKWNEDNDILKTILITQIYQYSESFINAENNSFKTLTGVSLINEIRNNPDKAYILSFYSKKTDGKEFNHAVVPYRVDGNRIYIWDNEYPYINISNSKNAYNQYIELDNNGKRISNTYTNVSIEEMSLVNILDIDNLNLIAPAGFNGSDQSFTLSGSSDLLVRDSLGRVSGFQNGNILKEIPGVNVIIPYNTTGEENTFKKIYVPQKQNLEVIVTGKSTEQYRLMIAGGDYYTKFDGVNTSLGQVDSYKSTRQNLKIDFDNSKTGNYNLLVDNFNNGTGTVYFEGMPSIAEKQNYDINWNKVINDDNDAVAYSVDANNDGSYENEQQLPSKYQYIIPTMMRMSIPTSTLEEESEEK